MSHTPGKWTCSGGNILSIYAPAPGVAQGSMLLAHVYGDRVPRREKLQPISDAECEANAALILAAPQMLEALKDSYSFMLLDNEGESRRHIDACICDGHEDAYCALCKARAAIQAAEGGGA